MSYVWVPNQANQGWPVSPPYEFAPDQTDQDWPVPTHYQTFPSGLVIPNTFELVTSVAPAFEVNASVDVVLDDDTFGVTAWLDRTGNANHYNNIGADATLPLWSSNGGPGGRGAISGDGVARFIRNTNWNPPAPGTTPIYFRGIWRLNAWGAANRHLWGGATASRLALRTVSSTPNVALFNTTQGSSVSMTLGQWFRVEAYYSNSTSDFLKIGSTSVTGINLGNNDQAEHALFCITTGNTVNCADASSARHGGFLGLPTENERADMDAADLSFFGAEVNF